MKFINSNKTKVNNKISWVKLMSNVHEEERKKLLHRFIYIYIYISKYSIHLVLFILDKTCTWNRKILGSLIVLTNQKHVFFFTSESKTCFSSSFFFLNFLFGQIIWEENWNTYNYFGELVDFDHSLSIMAFVGFERAILSIGPLWSMPQSNF